MSRLRVVVVDDDEIDRMIVRRVATRSGLVAEVFEEAAGDHFLQRLRAGEEYAAPARSEEPLLVFLDINMPRLTGYDVLRNLQEMRDAGIRIASCVVIVMYTSSASDADRRKSLDFDFVAGYIVKPLDPEQFKSALTRHISDAGFL